MLPILNIGPLAIQFPGLLILLGIYFSLMIAEKNSLKFDIKPNDISNLILIYFLSTLVIGRLTYIFQFPSIFFENPISIISINPNLVDFTSGLLFSLIVAYVFLQRKDINSLNMLDALSLPLLAFLLFFFLSQFSSGNTYGKPSDLPWAIELWGTNRHPLQIYYFLGVSAIILLQTNLQKKSNTAGILFIQTGIYFFLLVIFLDFFNGNPDNIFSNFNLTQIIAWVILSLLIFYQYKKISSDPKKLDLEDNQ